MITRALNPGDIVRLRSGGHWMTVETTDGTRAVCVYFVVLDGEDNDGQALFDPMLYRQTFNEVTLIHHDDAAAEAEAET